MTLPPEQSEALLALAARVEAMSFPSNLVDVLCEIALFEPDKDTTSIRANNAGTKVVYTYTDGSEVPYWASDWTEAENRAKTAAALRARSLALQPGGE